MPTDPFVEAALDKFKLAEEAESSWRKKAKDDYKFSAGEQWDERDISARRLDGRPCHTINRIPQFIRQVANDQRQNRPAVIVSPVDSKADPKTAEVLQGICRHIEVSSAADAAYDTAFEHAAKMGRGWWRVVLEFENDSSFNRRPRIKRIRNPFMVYVDPNCEEPDYSDMEWAFIVSNLRKEEYRERFPGSEIAGFLEGPDNRFPPGWLDKSTVRVAEYFYVQKSQVNLLLVRDPPGNTIVARGQVPEGYEVIDERPIEDRIIHHCMINALEKLETTTWDGKWIPLIPCLGEEIDLDGEVDRVGMVRYAKDPQRMINYWTSSLTENVALAPKAPYVGAEGQFENHESEWEEANRRNFAYLEYKPVDLGGNLAPPPQRNAIEPAILAVTNALVRSEDQLKAVMGIYDASLGARSNETSGIAIRARQVEGDTANFHLIDNLSRAIRHTGRILVDLIPKVMPPETLARILGEDQEERAVRVINNPESPAHQEGRSAIDSVYNVGVGKYDVSVQVGPSFQTKRQEAVESMAGLAKAWPQFLVAAGDLFVKNMDWPGAEEISNRLKALLPPEILQNEETKIPPQVQARIQGLTQELQLATRTIQELNRQIETKQVENSSKAQIEALKLASDERIAAMKVQADLIQTEAKLSSQEKIELLRQEIASIRDVLERNSYGQEVGPNGSPNP